MARLVGPETTILRTIVDKLLASDPSVEDSWNVDFKPCVPIAKQHLTRWSPDASERADRRARGKGSTVVSAKNSAYYIRDSKLETLAIRYTRQEPQALNKSGNAVSNACANLFLSRTSVPFYHGEQNAYPIQSANEKRVTSSCKDIWVYLRESSGSLNISTREHLAVNRAYFAAAPRIGLLVDSGLVGEAEAQQIMKKVYPSTFKRKLGLRSNPAVHPDLGNELHTLGDPTDKIHLCAIACRGAFSGLSTWNQFNNVLVQGGWPWLRRYSRSYAKTMYTAMVLVLVAIECYDLEDMDGMRERLAGLAGKLVGNPVEFNPWRVRKGAYLTGPKVTVPGDSLRSMMEKEAQVKITPADNAASGKTNASGPVLVWTYGSTSAVPWEGSMPSHIIAGTGCGHTNPSAPSARVKLATSVSELDELTQSSESLIIATTTDERARTEALSFAANNSIFAVSRSEGQCMSCAIKLAHCVGALVVVT